MTLYCLTQFSSVIFLLIFYYYFWFFFFHHNDGGLKFYTLLLFIYFYIENINYPMSQCGIELLKCPLAIFSPSRLFSFPIL